MDHSNAIQIEHESAKAVPLFLSTINLAMVTLIEAGYFLAREDIVMLKFERLTDLLETCKCPHLPCQLYRNRNGCHELITVLGNYLEFELIKVMCNSPYLGVMLDESTDFSVRKNLVIYVSLLYEGAVSTCFSHIIEMKECDAAALTAATIQYLEER